MTTAEEGPPAAFTLADGQPVPAVTAAQMREVDRAMTEDFGIELVQMMENAGRNLADLAWTRYRPGTVVVLAGPGGNGGGGLAAARHLLNRGADVTVVLSKGELAPVPAHQLAIARRMGIPVPPEPPAATWSSTPCSATACAGTRPGGPRT